MVCIRERPHISYGRSLALHFRYLTCLLDRGHITSLQLFCFCKMCFIKLYKYQLVEYFKVWAVNSLDFFFFSTDTDIKFDVVIFRNLANLLQKIRKVVKCNICLFQNAIDEDCVDVVVASYHSV